MKRKGKEYIIKEGDTLSSISKNHYGFKFLWRIIYKKNKDTIGRNPNLMHPGTIIYL